MMDEVRYTIKIFYSEEDEGYIAVVPELPGCSAFGETPEEALKEVKVAIELWIEAAKKEGISFPICNPTPTKLKKGEIYTILGLVALGGKAKISDLIKILKYSKRYIRKILKNLVEKGIIVSSEKSVLPVGFSSLDKTERKTKEKTYTLQLGFDELLDMYPEILELAMRDFGIKNKKELLEYLEGIRNAVRKGG